MQPVFLLEVVIDEFMALAVYVDVNEVEHCNKISMLSQVFLQITLGSTGSIGKKNGILSTFPNIDLTNLYYVGTPSPLQFYFLICLEAKQLIHHQIIIAQIDLAVDSCPLCPFARTKRESDT